LKGEELDSVYKTASLVVSPSLYSDPFPGVNLEAALYGKPVITTCFGGAKEFIIDGQTGYVANPFNPEELAKKIIDILKDSEKAERFGKANFERLKNDFSTEKQAEILLGWYKKYEARF
jgi:glycosyltransferase involved in cell wall biosynthesis